VSYTAQTLIGQVLIDQILTPWWSNQPGIDLDQTAWFLDAIGALFDQTARIATDIGQDGDPDYQTGYGTLFTINPRFVGDTAICPTNQLPYCVAPGTRILTSDLRWRQAGSLGVGDSLLAFDEQPIDGHARRHWQQADVTRASEITRPCYRLTFADGLEIVCSAEHQWLSNYTPGIGQPYVKSPRLRWIETQHLPVGGSVRRLLNTWPEEQTYETGYLAAAFDGEGHVNRHNGSLKTINYAQRDNAMMAEVKRILEGAAVNFGVYNKADNRANDCFSLEIGCRAEALRVLGWARPHRLLPQIDLNALGSAQGLTANGDNVIVSKKFIGEQTVCAITTTSGTYVAEGLASHNCGQFVGVPIPPDTDDATARSLITSEAGMQRGSPSAIVAAARRYLSGTQNVQNLTRVRPDGTPDPFYFSLVVRPEEVLDAAALVAAVNAVKPAWLMWTLVQRDGSIWLTDSGTWAADVATWASS
jgi:hypothetical protein